MSKKCIFNEQKICDNCGKCLVCDLDKNKVCNNCGKCLELDGVDIHAIKIEDIAKNVEENSVVEENIENDYTLEECIEENSTCEETQENLNLDSEYEDAWEHIEYIDEVQDLLNSEDLDEFSDEEFPGLIRIKKRN